MNNYAELKNVELNRVELKKVQLNSFRKNKSKLNGVDLAGIDIPKVDMDFGKLSADSDLFVKDDKTALEETAHEETMLEKSALEKIAKTSLLSQWRGDVRAALERDPAARNAIEVMTTYPGVHAIVVHRLSHWLWLRGVRYLARLLSCITRFLTNVDIHPGAVIGVDFFIDHGAGVVIGETSVIGNKVTLYHGVTLGGTSWTTGKRHPTLGDNVMVGAGAKILGPIDVGNNSRVGANSVVVADVPESCTVVGIPGKIVKVREAGRQNAYGVDLDHHLIPDPVGKLIACMLERIETLESRVVNLGGTTGGDSDADEMCCDPDNEICEVHCTIASR